MSDSNSKRPKCFISSSSEDIAKVHIIQHFLENEGVETLTWDQGVFFPGMTVIENFRDVISKVDFVICLIPSEAFEMASRNNDNQNSRDNIMFELGLAVGSGKPVFSLVENDKSIKIPSDLTSMLYLKYEPEHIEYSLKNIRNWVMHSFKNIN